MQLSVLHVPSSALTPTNLLQIPDASVGGATLGSRDAAEPRASVRFLPQARFYRRTEDCLAYLRELVGEDENGCRPSQRYHMYWFGPFGRKPAFAVKSFLATQDPGRSELWLWLDADEGYEGHQDNEFLAPLIPHITVRRFCPGTEARGTPLERAAGSLNGDMTRIGRPNFFRLVVLHNHGGVYVDADTMFLRDMGVLLDVLSPGEEFCYQWSSKPCGTTAIMRLHQGGETVNRLLARCEERGSCRPRNILAFEDGADLDLLVLPCVFFDPLWLHFDSTDSYLDAPFDRFADFFRRFGWRFRPKPEIRSHRDFFPGAFAYQWHNCWRAREHEASYFGMFEREFDRMLTDKLGLGGRPERGPAFVL
jgi:hypothetical protein